MWARQPHFKNNLALFILCAFLFHVFVNLPLPLLQFQFEVEVKLNELGQQADQVGVSFIADLHYFISV